MKDLKFTPVLEFEPCDFSTNEKVSPKASFKENPEDWYHYWKESLADSNIINLEPYTKGSWFVPLSSITEESHLICYLENFFSDIEEDEDLTVIEQTSSLYGGYILEYKGSILYPQCCGTLEDLSEWESSLNLRQGQTESIWIGHPQLMASCIDDNTLRFDETCEYSSSTDLIEIEVTKTELTQAIQKAKNELKYFGKRISSIVQKLYPEDYRQVVEILINGHS